MIGTRPIIYTLGLLCCTLAAGMLVPAAVDLADGHPHAQVFFWSAVITIFFGGLMVFGGHEEKQTRLGIRDGFLLTTLAWIIVCGFAAVPFVGLGLSYADAYFEAMSGLTTTGATVLVGLDKLPRGVLIWRAILNGIGGMGIIVMAILIMPFLRVGGMQLFQTESSDRSEKILPRASELTLAIASVYGLLIVSCTFVYTVLGMTLFDAICHALATIATGGFSSHDESFAFFRSPAIEWAGTVFMIAGALPLVVFIKLIGGQPLAFWRDEQARAFLILLAVLWMAMALWLSATTDRPFLDALRACAFNITSIITTTGFASENYQAWGSFAIGFFFILSFVGGCSGSTTGGLKIYRFQIAERLIRSHFLHLITPSRIITLTYNGRRLPEDVPFSVIAFMAMYMATVGIFTVLLTAFGLDVVTSASSAAAAVGNLTLGLGEIVGPGGNYSTLPAGAKWCLSLAMLLGRLELFTVLVLLRPEFWRS